MIQASQRCCISTVNPSYQHCAGFWDKFIPYVASCWRSCSLEWRQQAACCPSMEDIHALKMQHKGITVRCDNTCELFIIPSKPPALSQSFFDQNCNILIKETTLNCQIKLASLVTHRNKNTFTCRTATTKCNFKKHPEGELRTTLTS